MLDALQMDLRCMPGGMRSQNSIVLPKTRAGMPPARRCAARESPYGPAPRIATDPCFTVIHLFLPTAGQAALATRAMGAPGRRECPLAFQTSTRPSTRQAERGGETVMFAGGVRVEPPRRGGSYAWWREAHRPPCLRNAIFTSNTSTFSARLL